MRQGPGVLTLHAYPLSNPGKRAINEDAYLCHIHPEIPGWLDGLFVVADGIGGRQTGQIASSVAARTVRDTVLGTNRFYSQKAVRELLLEAFARADSAVHEASLHESTLVGMGTTLTIGAVAQRRLFVASLGDSRAYLLRRGLLEQISQDHSWAAAGEKAGLSEEWVGRHVLTRALGTKPHVEVDLFGPLPLEAGDRLILCSDGLTTPLSDAEIQEIADRYPPQRASEALIQAANERGGPDNVSALVVKVKGPGQGRAGGAGQEASEGILDRVDRALGLVPGRLRLTPALIAAALLAALILVGLGFALGLLVLGH